MRYCSLASGSDGNCHYIEHEQSCVLVDIGISLRTAEQELTELGLNPAGIRAVLVTHEHSDHIQGVGAWARRYKVPVMASAGTWEAMQTQIGAVPEALRVVLEPGKGYRLAGGLRIEPFPTFHDAREPFGYCLEGGGKTITILTDTGTVSREMEEYLLRSQFAVVESNHDLAMLLNGPYPWPLKKRIRSNLGHLSNEDCGRFLARVMTQHPELRVLLGHLSEENNEPQLALTTVRNLVLEAAPVDERQIGLTRRGAATAIYEF